MINKSWRAQWSDFNRVERVNKCRGQSYDNAANMAGRYNGMQQKILERNKFAKFIACAGHSLNLLGRSAVDCCLDAVNCFGIINEINTFFSASTKRWAVLKSFLQPQSKVPKHLSDTRWDAHAKAREAILESYSATTNALSHLHSDVRRVIPDFMLTTFCKKWKN